MQGKRMYQLIQTLFNINRSITGNGVRESLSIINDQLIPKLQFHEVPTGTKVFDWTVPKEWNVNHAKLYDSNNNVIIDFDDNNLHLMGYSIPFKGKISLKKLKEHLYTIPDQPNVIPYVTSYYKRQWGLCLKHSDFLNLKDDVYYVDIDTELKDGYLTYADLLIPGNVKQEIFFSTYICHPSMANNELSGPALISELINHVSKINSRHFSYRFVILPETIGSLTYLSKNLNTMKVNIIAGYNLTCVGDNHNYSFLPSKFGNTISDEIARHVLNHKVKEYKEYTFLDRGSDERQYCSPGADLPVSSVMRTKYGEYKQYHTSADDLNFISQDGLQGSFDVYVEIINSLEKNKYYKIKTVGEPQLGKRGLYNNTSYKNSGTEYSKNLLNILAYLDGTLSLLEIAKYTNLYLIEVHNIINSVIETDPSLIKKL